ncbi:MAG: metallophosphoesterase [Cyanobacteria bacterium SW_4_48_29]|nr:MAG: metallophosphoesterase [Cyanobacteria bacterium QH_1_48_107]PSO61712.1 MAG: metallophosphoesterase [Cyanobacteria bacterium QH_7_48_89]PSO71806.1 MAG: metallophosphoesterase [Cyanobacteria bacterium QS_1_48_34]PSO78365.1 MAG: metallophosphoesterase [Cyanobacteria bacterium QH_3_48_40]PSP14477.1 MAG: metallophosphoesterase [Cyanobacteria bacterium SW_11_48_12]PSP21096.1 MAG: metallophosphoesterase [Cyanobacteria bacterium SW_8_48_13]PSP30574.1 MAG: metallophosphoesterase [Cyanobacteria
MSMKRRQFIFLGSLGSVGLAALWQHFYFQTSQNSLSNRTANAASTPEVNIPPGEPLQRFVSVADTGTGGQGQYAVAKVMTQYYRQNLFPLAILAGDNIYNDGNIEKIKQVFEQPYQPLLQQGVPFHACLGNHDIRTDNGEPQVRYPGFNMQGRYYTFSRSPIQYFALDTNHNADWQAQLSWLDEKLSRSAAPWKVVFGHHQIYSSGRYGTNQNLASKLTPLFRHYGVQLYINGHDHDYERTQSINGTTYLTCGAGAGVRPVERSDWTAYSASRLSFAAFDVYADQMVIKGIGTDGTVFDQGLISRAA